MIGYYVHHHGRGHLHRALCLAEAVEEPLTVLSSLPAPVDSEVAWVHLERDDLGPDPVHPAAGGRLHWAPLGDDGLRRRMAQISGWIEQARPRLMVVDVSVEVALLARLHGVPTVGVMQPGRRYDAPHRLAFDVCDRLVGLWPARLTERLLPGVPAEIRDRVIPLGALARMPVARPEDRGDRGQGPRRVTLLMGAGGHDVDADAVQRAVVATPDWSWTVLDGRADSWVEDPSAALRGAEVVICHAGQNSLAEVAAARRPAVVVPQDRPYDEQVVTAAVLADDQWPALVVRRFPEVGWPELLARAARLNGERWAQWCDGWAAQRFAEVVESCGPRVGVRAQRAERVTRT